MYEVSLSVWVPPSPEVQKANESLDVSGKTGYIVTDMEGSCTMDVEASPAWIQIDTNAPLPEGGADAEPRECVRAGKLVTKAFAQLGW